MPSMQYPFHYEVTISLMAKLYDNIADEHVIINYLFTNTNLS